ncbi:MAG: proteasome subunit alpha [Verrucomicrobiae bacterium]|nr:proteasome subunit alpha [Verrucomicrobiae bacterium]
MTEEPYRWIEAIGNRREYVETQLRGGSPVFAASLDDGILLLGVGTGHSKVFEIFDRHALAGLGHPTDLERVRQTLIDAAHLEAFTRASADVSLRRLVSFGLGPQLKTAFEQLFSPPFLVRLLLAEVGQRPTNDLLVRLDFDGSFELRPGGVAIAADSPSGTAAAGDWLAPRIDSSTSLPDASLWLLEAWHRLTASEPFPADLDRPRTAWTLPAGRQVEAALLRRTAPGEARYQPLDPAQLVPPPA